MENMLKAIASSIKMEFPTVKAAEDELVDPQVVLRDQCGEAHCASLQEKYDACNQRVNSKQKTAETCTEELIDFMHCVDHCVAQNLFKKLK